MNKQSLTLKLIHNGDFENFGVSVIAYVKKVDLAGLTAYAIHGADGKSLGIEPTEAMALSVAQQRNLFPVMVQ